MSRVREADAKPDDPTFYLALASSYERLQTPDEAVRVYQKYLELWPNAPAAAQVKGRLASIASDGRLSRFKTLAIES